MAITHFVPEIWAARLLTSLKTTHVGASICNRDYEGDVESGKTVHITSIARPTITSYVKGTPLSYEDLDDATRALLIDQQQSFAFAVEDIDHKQVVNGGALMGEAADEAAFGLADVLDTFALDLIASGVDSGNVLSAQTLTTPSSAYELLVDLGVALDEADVPSVDRWAVVTPAFHGKLLKDDRFVGSGAATADGRLVNGFVGTAAGFTIRKSNNLPGGVLSTASGMKTIVAGTNRATTLAEQIVKVEPLRLIDQFADALRGLHVYGAKVVRPDFLVSADVVVA